MYVRERERERDERELLDHASSVLSPLPFIHQTLVHSYRLSLLMAWDRCRDFIDYGLKLDMVFIHLLVAQQLH